MSERDDLLANARDPNFTAGLDPVEYLRRLHEGEDMPSADEQIATLTERVRAAEARAVRCEGALTDYAALVEVAQGVNTSLRLLPLTGIDDAQHIYDSMYKILDRLARWLIDTPAYPGKPAPREIPLRP